jgi:gliding motility-associated-like protein
LIPVITNFTPTSGAVGTSVIINGANFSTTPANNVVVFNGTAAVVTASTATSITTAVPTGATTGKISVTVAGNSATSASDFTVIQPPTITSFTPLSGTVGTTVTITGTNFSTTPANNVAAFNGTTAVVTASTATSITTSVPIGATTGKILVTVAGNTATSASDFTVTTPGGEVTITPETLATNIGGTASLNLVDLITTLNNNLDVNSITVSVPPPSGALAEVVDGVLTVDYTDISFSGRENITIRACDTDANCATQLFEIEVIGNIEVYNGISPNNDLQNEKFIIQYIDVLPETQNNKVSIFNRWGDVVWEGINYNNQTVVFTGKNKNGQELPSGTYFYKIQFSSGRKSETGYLVIKK